MVRTSEITITQKNYTQLGLTFKKDKNERLIFAKSNVNPTGNIITRLLSGCYPLYLLGYAEDKGHKEYQCIEFEKENDGDDNYMYTAYSEYLTNLITERIETFYKNASPETPFIIYYASITLAPDFGITTMFRTKLDKITSGSSSVGYKITPMDGNSIFKFVEYLISLFMYNNADIECSIRFLTSFINSLEQKHKNLINLSELDSNEKPTPIYHYAVIIQGSAKLQIELRDKKSNDGLRRIIVNGSQEFLDQYGITPNSNFIGFKDVASSTDDFTIFELGTLPIGKRILFMKDCKKKMTENAKFLLFLTSTENNARETASAARARARAEEAKEGEEGAEGREEEVEIQKVVINNNRPLGITLDMNIDLPVNRIVLTEARENPYKIKERSKLNKIIYHNTNPDTEVDITDDNLSEEFKRFIAVKSNIVEADARTYITLVLESKKATGGKSYKTKRHGKKSRRGKTNRSRRKTKRPRKKSKCNKKTRISKH